MDPAPTVPVLTPAHSLLLRSLRDVGFPSVVALILLYAAVWRFPEVIDRQTDKLVVVLRELESKQDATLRELVQIINTRR